MAKSPPHMGDPHGDPQTSPQHADPHGRDFPCSFQGFLCNLVRRSPQMWRKLPNPRSEKIHEILSRLWPSSFFRSRCSCFFQLQVQKKPASLHDFCNKCGLKDKTHFSRNAEGCRNPLGISCSEDREANLSPCNFTTTHFPAEKLRDRPPFNSLLLPVTRNHPNVYQNCCYRGSRHEVILQHAM